MLKRLNFARLPHELGFGNTFDYAQFRRVLFALAVYEAAALMQDRKNVTYLSPSQMEIALRVQPEIQKQARAAPRRRSRKLKRTRRVRRFKA